MNSPFKNTLFIIVVVMFSICAKVHSQGFTSKQIDSLVQETMVAFPDQAGIAVAVVKDGKIIHSKGYGVTSIESGKHVDKNTLFAIASNSKAFTAAALALLVEEGKISWNDKVIDHIPEFKMYAPWVTENFTIIDLLAHRSGLGLGAGDLLVFPDGGNCTIDDILNSFQYQTPVSQFRTKYDYDNLLFIVAGEIITRKSGMSWSEFIENRIMTPLEMKNSAGSLNSVKNHSNIALPHSSETGELVIIEPYTMDLMNAAGGIYASVADLSRWMLLQLNKGKYGDSLENTLFSTRSQQQMWKAQTIISYDARGENSYNQHLKAYGLGWQIEDQNGYTLISHSGGLPGMLSMTLLYPELDLGIVVLTNSLPGGYSYLTISRSIADSYIGAKNDWITIIKNHLLQSNTYADSIVSGVWNQVEKNKKVKIDLEKYIGNYKDPWFGKVSITNIDNQLWFTSAKSPKLTGMMYYYNATTFAIKWNYKGMECDAFATFQIDKNGNAIGITMEGISPNIDFSFDFHDLNLEKIK